MSSSVCCGLCLYTWIDENNLTLLCSSSNCMISEYHLFCLSSLSSSTSSTSSSSLSLQLPEDERDWLCPTCHSYSQTIQLISYFKYFKENLIQIKNKPRIEFINYIKENNLIGKVIKLHIPEVHIGRIISKRTKDIDEFEYFVQFRSGVNGRNFPFSCWIDLSSHDCSISTDIIQVPSRLEGSNEITVWIPVERYILSGIEFESIPGKLNTHINITLRHPLHCYVLFTQHDYLEIPTGSSNNTSTTTHSKSDQSLLIKEFPSPDVKFVRDMDSTILLYNSIAECELYERSLCNWKYTCYSQLLSNENQSTNSIENSTITENDLQILPPDHPNIPEYNAWLNTKKYVSSGSLLDGATLHDMYLILQKQQVQLEQLKKASKKVNSNNNIEKYVHIHPSIIYELKRSANTNNISKEKLEEVIGKLQSNEIISIDLNKLSYENFDPNFQLSQSNSDNSNNSKETSFQSTKISLLTKRKWKPLNFYNDLCLIYNNLQSNNENTTDDNTLNRKK